MAAITRQAFQRPASARSGAAMDWNRTSCTESEPLSEASGIRPFSKIRMAAASVSSVSAQGVSSTYRKNKIPFRT